MPGQWFTFVWLLIRHTWFWLMYLVPISLIFAGIFSQHLYNVEGVDIQRLWFIWILRHCVKSNYGRSLPFSNRSSNSDGLPNPEGPEARGAGPVGGLEGWKIADGGFGPKWSRGETRRRSRMSDPGVNEERACWRTIDFYNWLPKICKCQESGRTKIIPSPTFFRKKVKEFLCNAK